MLAPAVEAASEKHTDVNFYRLNIDNAMDIARKFRVMSIPTLIVFENGEEVNKYQVVREFTSKVKEKALGEEVKKSLSPGEMFVGIIRDELEDLLK